MITFDLGRRAEIIEGRPTLAVDLDDVFFAFNDGLALWHNETYGTNYSVEDVKGWDLNVLWGCSPEEAVERVNQFYKSEQHQNMQLIDDALEALEELKKNYILIALTGRPDKIASATLQLLLKRSGILFDQVHFTDRYSDDDLVKRTSKGEICKQHNVSVLIDDGVHNAISVLAQSPTTQVLLFDRPWNRGITLLEGMVRVRSWKEVVEFINQSELATT